MDTAAPLSGLVAQSLIALSKDYDRLGAAPPLPLWSNFLRVVPDEGLAVVDAPRAARISRRAMRAILTGCETWGIVKVAKGAGRGNSTVHVTEDGRRARDAGQATLERAEAAWRSHFRSVDGLRDAAGRLVAEFDLELPHFPLGYGAADDSVTGGHSVPAKDGPPPLPAHGQDWRPVLRTDRTLALDLPLSALLSQVFVMFAIDFEAEGGSLPTSVIFQQIRDDGLPVSQLPNGCPNPAGWERNGLVTLNPSPLKKRSVVSLTTRGRAMRDAYVSSANEIEQSWGQRYGDDLVQQLRAAAEAFVDEAGVGHLPHAPIVSWINGLREVTSATGALHETAVVEATSRQPHGGL